MASEAQKRQARRKREKREASGDEEAAQSQPSATSRPKRRYRSLSEGANLLLYANVALLASILRDDLIVSSLHQLYLAPLERHGTGKVARRRYAPTSLPSEISPRPAAALRVDRRTVRNRIRAIDELLGRHVRTWRSRCGWTINSRFFSVWLRETTPTLPTLLNPRRVRPPIGEAASAHSRRRSNRSLGTARFPSRLRRLRTPRGR